MVHDGALIIAVQALLNDDVSITHLTALCMTCVKLTLISVKIPDINTLNITQDIQTCIWCGEVFHSKTNLNMIDLTL